MQRLLTAALTTAAGAGMVITGVPAVHAETRVAPSIGPITVSPALAVETGARTQTIRFRVRATGAVRVRVKVRDRAGTESVIVDPLRQTAPGLWQGSGLLYNYEAPGTHSVVVTATDSEFDDTVARRTFQVRRATYFSGFKAGPSPIRRGRKITVKGQLRTLNNGGKYAGYRGVRVGVFFKRSGTHTWVRLAVVTTGRNGGFLKKFGANASGSWKVQFVGNGTRYKSASKPSAVRVR